MGPKDPECWIMRGACYVGIQKFAAALKDIEKAFVQIKKLEDKHNMDCSGYLAKYEIFSIVTLSAAYTFAFSCFEIGHTW